MTRTRDPIIRAIAWRGELGEPASFVAVLPPQFRDRYLAGGRLRVANHATAPTILSLTVTDRDTGAKVRMRGQRVTLAADPTATGEYVGRLWQDARAILGIAHRQMGRGPGAIRDDDQIRRVVAAMRRDGLRVTAPAIAAYSGQFTVDNLRYWFRTRHRKLRDY